MEQIFTPWRHAYITAGSAADSGCFFCHAAGHPDDPDGLVVHRGRHHLVMLNLHPYASGHLMVVPLEHLASPQEGAPEAAAELWPLGLRGLAFFVLVLAAILIGCRLEGNLYQVTAGQPLTILATLASVGMGFAYFLLRYFFHYQGNIMGAGYEYGTAFLLTAGLMNLLLVLDAWDIVRGKKE